MSPERKEKYKDIAEILCKNLGIHLGDVKIILDAHHLTYSLSEDLIFVSFDESVLKYAQNVTNVKYFVHPNKLFLANWIIKQVWDSWKGKNRDFYD